MRIFWLSLVLIVASNAVYHVAQKSVPSGAHPLLSLCVTYVVALAATLLLLPFFPVRAPLSGALRQLSWPSVAIGIAIVGVELGFLLAYRSGWRIGLASTVSAATLAVILVPTSALAFGERLSAGNVFGLVLCLAGLALAVPR